MSAHRRARAHSTKVRRSITAAVVAVAAGAGFLAAAGPAAAAGPWFVATNGNNSATCLSAATPCLTVTGVLAKPGFVDGDTINVAAGTYADKPLFGAKTATVIGAGIGATIFSGTSTTYAIGVNITNAKTLNLSGMTLTLGKTANGLGGALVIATGKVVTTNVALTNSTATNVGGAAYVPAGASLTMTGGSATGNTATNGGGAFYNAGTTSLTGVTVTGNTSPLGGGAYNNTGGVFSTNGGSVSSNTASGAGGGLYSLATLNVTGTTLDGNKSAIGAGAAFAGTPTFTNATITNNLGQGASSQGGGLFNNTGNLVVSGSTISGNTAVSGAGIYQQAGTTTVSGASSIKQNTATNGGGLYNQAGTTTVSGSELKQNSASATGGAAYSLAGTLNLTNATTDNNTAGALAGAAAVVGGTGNVTGGSLSGNSAPNGGALYNGGTTTIDGSVLNNNTGAGTAAANTGNAGAIYNAAALTVKNATFTGNKVTADTASSPGTTGYGGAIFGATLAANSPTIDLTNTTINGGAVAGGNAVIGGAIAVFQSVVSGGATTKLTGTGLTLSKNVAGAAGGLFSYGSITLNGSTIDQNQATHASSGYGGGLYLAVYPGVTVAPVGILDNTAVTGNTATLGGGGGIIGGFTMTIRNGSKVNGNSAPTGAGLYSGAALTVTDSHVDGNNASNSGGGLYVLAATSLTNTTVDNNVAAFLGGGLVAAAPITMTGGEFDSNNGYGAGGVLVGDSVVASFDGTDFTDNTSTGANFGGGAILSGGQVTVRNAAFTGNTADGASGSGGAIFSGSSNDNVTTSLRLVNSLIADNDAFAAPAILTGSSGTGDTNKTAILNSTISGNTASGTIGALELLAPTSITSSTITDNTATGTNNVGALYAAAGTVSISGSILSGNSGFQCAAAPTDGGYNLNSPTDSRCGFSAAKNDLFAAPQLGALANNGGPTQTRLPGAASPALDKIAPSTATGVTDAIDGSAISLCGAGATDQRGTARPQGAKCDIGAVEADQIAPTVSGPGAFTYTVAISGAPQTYTSTGSPQPTLSATGLPGGVVLTDNGDGTGTISGTPDSGTGGVYTVTVKATNEAGSATKTVTLTVNQAPMLAGPDSDTYTVGQAGGPTTFTTTGNPVSVLTSLGILPGGVGFTDNGDGTGQYAGTPTGGTGGTYHLTVHATNGTPPDADKPFTLTVDEAPGLTGPSSATFKVGTASSSTPDFSGSGFPVPVLSATGLPSGLSLVSTGPGTAKISGTPANGTGNDYPNVVVKADNGVGTAATKTVDVTVNEAPELVGPTAARFVTGSPAQIGFSSDGYPVASVTATGDLPSWLTPVDNGNGSMTISGTAPADAVGTYHLTITASNGQSPDAVIHLTIEVVPPLSISTTTLPNAAFHTAYSAQVQGTGGQPAYSFQVISGSLPPGLSMNQFGLITGSANVSSGSYSFTVQATDSANPAQTATKTLTIQVGKGDTTVTPTAILLGFPPNGDITLNLGQVEADLTGGSPAQPIANATITFKSGGSTVCIGKTDVKGHAQCSQSLLDAILTPLRGNLTATFAGDANWNGSSGTASLIQ